MKPQAGLLLAIVALLVGASSANAATKVVNFDGLTVGETVGTQYASSGVSFTQPTDPGYAPVIRSAPGQAHSGSQVADIETCVPSPCPEFAGVPDTRGELSTEASSVSVYVGYIGGGSNTASAELIGYTTDGAVVQESGLKVVTEGTPFATRLEVSSATANIAYFDLKDPEAGDFGAKVAMDDLTIVTPDAPQPPDFTLSPGLGVLDVLQGQSVQDPLTVSRINGSTGNIAMSVSGLPAGMTGTFSPNPLTGTETGTTLTVTAAQGAAASSNYSKATITATPSPTAGSMPHSVTTETRISSNCANTVTFEYVDLRSPGCLVKQGTSQYVALNTEVHIDGLVLKPLDGDHVLTIDTAAKTIKSDLGATYSVSVLGSPRHPLLLRADRMELQDQRHNPSAARTEPSGQAKEA